jgi:hypothetical protein
MISQKWKTAKLNFKRTLDILLDNEIFPVKTSTQTRHIPATTAREPYVGVRKGSPTRTYGTRLNIDLSVVGLGGRRVESQVLIRVNSYL